MTEEARILTETVFNILYLLVVWGLVAAMFKRWAAVAQNDRGAALSVLAAFAFLALGDTGHVGFRVIAFSMGGLDTEVNLSGHKLNLAALGTIATAWTFTVFYVCMLFMWKERFNKKFGTLAWLLFGLALMRSLIMLHPANEWNSLDIQEPWYTIRNIPLMLMQAGTLYLILRDAAASKDNFFKWIGIMIIISLACYAPVVVFIKTYPLVGMLMIPKTLAYLGIAVIAFKCLYAKNAAVHGEYGKAEYMQQTIQQ